MHWSTRRAVPVRPGPDLSLFVRLGTFIFNVGVLLSKACESFSEYMSNYARPGALHHVPRKADPGPPRTFLPVSESLVDSSQSIENLISTSQCNKGEQKA